MYGSALIPCFSDHLFFVSDFVSCHAGISRVFPILSPMQLLRLFFIAWGIGINLCTRLLWLNDFSFSCNMIFIILVKRSFHVLPRRFIGLNNASVFCLAILFNATGFPVLLTFKFAKHSGWHRNFQLSTRIIHDSFEFLIIRINEVNTTQISSIVELRFLDSTLLLFLCISTHQTYLSKSQATKCLVWRSFVLLSLPGPRKSIRWFFIQHNESCGACPRICQFSISINVPIIVDIFLQQYIQRCTWSPGHVDIFQWHKKWFFSRHVQFDSVFYVMTINEFSWNRPEVIFSFRIIPCWVVLKWGWRRESVWFSLKIALFFPSVWAIPDQGGCSQNLISSREFYRSIRDWGKTFHHSWALTLPLRWVFSRRLQMRPSVPIPQRLRPRCLLSRFSPCKT